MPIYEYACAQCGSKEEKIQSMSAPSEHDCPQCETGLGMQRLVSRTAFVLAGSGWFAGGYGEDVKGTTPGAARGGEVAGASEPASGDPVPAAGCAGGCACHSTPSASATAPVESPAPVPTKAAAPTPGNT